jgi:hypothetical protein
MLGIDRVRAIFTILPLAAMPRSSAACAWGWGSPAYLVLGN